MQLIINFTNILQHLSFLGRCGRNFKTHICLRHSDKKLQKHQLFAYGEHSSGDFTKPNRSTTLVAIELIEKIIQDYDSKPFRIHMGMQRKKYANTLDTLPTLVQ